MAGPRDGLSMTKVNYSEQLGIELGPLIDAALAERVSAEARRALSGNQHAVQLFYAGLLGTLYRAKDAAQHLEVFKSAWATEPRATPQERATQEEVLFGAVTAAASAVENQVFAGFVLVQSTLQGGFSKGELKASRERMVRAIEAEARTADLGRFLRSSFADADCAALYELRDFLVHRGKLPRNHWVGGPHHGTVTIARNVKDDPAVWLTNLAMNDAMLDKPVAWAERHLHQGLALLEAALKLF
ncbi:hypothetical protein ACQ858_15960 [Variovorax ureilyticus]|uniref:hypothetical protein n=1 Tax=Variovorax ureilyticus TaxID=1836198 RepID=UPI003D673E97